jgi:hypothetical protein
MDYESRRGSYLRGWLRHRYAAMSNLKIFNPTAEHPARAVQAWQILVGKAMNRQTVTYKGLSKLMYGKDAAGVLAAILGHIAFFCEDNDIPPLTALVVGMGLGSREMESRLTPHESTKSAKISVSTIGTTSSRHPKQIWRLHLSGTKVEIRPEKT